MPQTCVWCAPHLQMLLVSQKLALLVQKPWPSRSQTRFSHAALPVTGLAEQAAPFWVISRYSRAKAEPHWAMATLGLSCSLGSHACTSLVCPITIIFFTLYGCLWVDPESIRLLGANQHPFLMDLCFTTHPNRHQWQLGLVLFYWLPCMHITSMSHENYFCTLYGCLWAGPKSIRHLGANQHPFLIDLSCHFGISHLVDIFQCTQCQLGY
jgi:hypothetical protein